MVADQFAIVNYDTRPSFANCILFASAMRLIAAIFSFCCGTSLGCNDRRLAVTQSQNLQRSMRVIMVVRCIIAAE